VLEESEEEPKVVPEVVLEGGTMVVVHTVAPSPPHGATEASSSAPRATAALDAAAGGVGGLEAVMGHPTFHAPGDVPLDEAMGMAHQALS
jgi:hypothetical protein